MFHEDKGRAFSYATPRAIKLARKHGPWLRMRAQFIFERTRVSIRLDGIVRLTAKGYPKVPEAYFTGAQLHFSFSSTPFPNRNH